MICFSFKNSVLSKEFHRQLSATLTALMVVFSYGISLGWITPLLYILQSNDSPLTFKISIEDTSWIGSLSNAGGLIGTVFFGYLIDRAGRKICLYILPLPHIAFWIIVYFSKNAYHLYLARFVGGITGGGIFLIFPIFISEIADPKIRGTLGSLIPLLTNVGVLVGYIVGSHVPYYIVPPVVIVLPAVSLLFMIYYPETPQHLLRKGHYDQAKRSLEYYTNFKKKNTNDESKFDTHFMDLKTAIEVTNQQQKVTFNDFCNKRAITAMATGITIIFINVFCGYFSITNYSTLIFAETKSSIDPNTSTIVIGVVMILGSYFASYFVDKFGRRILMMLSSGSMALGLSAIGTHAYLTNWIDLTKFPLLPVVIISFIIFAGSTGIAAINSVLIVEVLPPKIRSWGTTICQIILGIFSFGALKIFPILMANIGLWGVMWIFASVASFGFFFFLFCLQETKGKSLDDDNAFN
ncbi:facilitated trehalose transporter Tret1-like [Episyrphus balteatus]|uniref:facilitated trehalose transporter Tret1-like n=1 Tax=Episyrphus balteatus TaxID=286459 RepID=UPI002486974A|nr:facilitated trehalose transporter Tret1-like [Episyrphus balteatus]